MGFRLYYVLHNCIRIIDFGLFLYWIISWIAPRSRFYDILDTLLSPFVAPFRKLSYKMMSRFGARLDFSIFFTMIAFSILDYLLRRLFLIF